MDDSLRVTAEKRADAKIKFYKDFIIYIIVNLLLAAVNFTFTPEFWWVLFPAFFWGIAVFDGFLKAFVFSAKFDTAEYREQKIQEEMEKLRK
ncbi:2TM domain-containing protein [Methanobrevibacter sp.]|uniref:2TM domain-containing protein n=1 Tax=Methanobrevibacter sp. TaxID=66852 RepID=UPI0026E024F7|nr:2TM domain-containing protein [Methanobrevibacter sp.]MDO5823373.1 2TM domain-containing protein [Methanobrevibacter sp.]